VTASEVREATPGIRRRFLAKAKAVFLDINGRQIRVGWHASPPLRTFECPRCGEPNASTAAAATSSIGPSRASRRARWRPFRPHEVLWR
jgi:hypothetical protein